MLFDQSMSEFKVKSCIGTLIQVDLGLCCVTFLTPRSVRANFVLMYLKAAFAVNSSSKGPTEIKVSVAPMSGAPMSGVLKASPIAPVPLASGINILNLLM